MVSPFSRQIVLSAVFATFAGVSFGSPLAKVVPLSGKSTSFSTEYTTDFLKGHPLKRVKKTNFTLKKNKMGLLTATWNATIRDIRSDAPHEVSATGLCKPLNRRSVECTFDASAGTVELKALRKGLVLSIPVGQGVSFTEKKGGEYTEVLLGADDDDAEFVLRPKDRVSSERS